MGRILAFLYGVLCYAVFFLAFLYLIGFIADVGVPKGIDDGAGGLQVVADPTAVASRRTQYLRAGLERPARTALLAVAADEIGRLVGV
jgi:hypothetical protein